MYLYFAIVHRHIQISLPKLVIVEFHSLFVYWLSLVSKKPISFLDNTPNSVVGFNIQKRKKIKKISSLSDCYDYSALSNSMQALLKQAIWDFFSNFAISKTEKTEKSRFQKLKKSQIACFKRVFLLTYIKCITSISIVQKSPSANKVYRTVEFNN